MPQANGVYESVVDLIGGTPLVRIRKFEGLDRVRLYAKLEFFNPGGSVKDRIGPHMIRAAESQGKLRPGGTIIEPTAGNTGIGLALAALEKGYRVILVVPEHFSQEKQALMKALGAEIVNTPREKGMAGAIEKAKELAAQIENSFIPQQFANPANPQAHYDTTGPEIYEQLQGQIDIFVAGVGTGGTFTGTARYLKEKIPGLRAVAVEPEGSILCGGQPGPHRTEGIGVEFIPETLDTRLIDKVYTVSDDDAFAMVKELARREGILCGSSSGAAFYAAWQEAKQARPGSTVVVVFPDSSERYLSKGIYD
ncbi:MAG: cysteine synthase A [Bacillota bacterium]|nr:cysteine synthase A [Bacillota bacterium]REJ32521.1 MAG: cysteine synthase A [Bacillota bacterium]